MKSTDQLLCIVLTACWFGVSLVAPAYAANSSTWSEDSKSAMRLIAGGNTQEAALAAGVELKLQPGWHTYWRYPGDSGVPPHFDFSGSDNLASARVHYPAPHLFTDESGNSIGYTGSVIFPVDVVPRDPSKPVTLRLKIDYAVCDKLCVPAQGSAELPVTSAPGARNEALARAQAQVPKEVSAAEAGLSVTRVNDAAKPMVAVDLKAPTGEPVTLFVEGPTPEWALPVPKPAQGAPEGHARFSFELDGLPPGVDPKGHFELTFTVVKGDKPMEIKTLEVKTRLD